MSHSMAGRLQGREHNVWISTLHSQAVEKADKENSVVEIVSID